MSAFEAELCAAGKLAAAVGALGNQGSTALHAELTLGGLLTAFGTDDFVFAYQHDLFTALQAELGIFGNFAVALGTGDLLNFLLGLLIHIFVCHFNFPFQTCRALHKVYPLYNARQSSTIL